MQRNRRHEFAVGALLIVGIGILSVLAIEVGAFKVDTGTVRLQAMFDNVAGLNNGAIVSVAGVDVGRVTGLAIDGERARVTLVVDGSVGVHQDGSLRLRARSVLGEKYLELHAGTASTPLLTDGDQVQNTEGQVEIDQMVTQMGPLLSAADPEALSKAIDAMSQAMAADPERLNRIVADTEVLVHNLRVASEDAPALVSEVRATVKETREAVAKVGPVLDRADAMITKLDGVSDPLAKASADIPGLLTDTRTTLAEARDMLHALDGSTGDLATILHNFKDLDLTEVRRLIREEGVLVRLRPHDVDEAEGAEKP